MNQAEQTIFANELGRLIFLQSYLYDNGFVKEAGLVGDLIESAKSSASKFWDRNKATIAKAALLVALGVAARDYMEEDSFTRDTVEFAEQIFDKLAEEDYIIHTVSKGESLWLIANQYYPEINSDDGIQIILDENDIQNADSIHPGQELRIPKTESLVQIASGDDDEEDEPRESGVQALTGNAREIALLSAASDAGMEGVELAQFMAQTNHESAGFALYKEIGRGRGRPYGKYYGRGPMQLTWKANYRVFGRADGVGNRYVNNPDLVAEDDIGARAAIWFWLENVRPRVSDFSDTTRVTRIVNGGRRGLREREILFNQYSQ